MGYPHIGEPDMRVVGRHVERPEVLEDLEAGAARRDEEHGEAACIAGFTGGAREDQVSTGPTEIAWVGTSEIFPPPDVRAFCAMVSGCKSTTRVVSLRYSAGEGGWSLNLPARRGGSLKAQCLTSPCPPCITAQRTPLSQVLR